MRGNCIAMRALAMAWAFIPSGHSFPQNKHHQCLYISKYEEGGWRCMDGSTYRGLINNRQLQLSEFEIIRPLCPPQTKPSYTFYIYIYFHHIIMEEPLSGWERWDHKRPKRRGGKGERKARAQVSRAHGTNKQGTGNGNGYALEVRLGAGCRRSTSSCVQAGRVCVCVFKCAGSSAGADNSSALLFCSSKSLSNSHSGAGCTQQCTVLLHS